MGLLVVRGVSMDQKFLKDIPPVLELFFSSACRILLGCRSTEQNLSLDWEEVAMRVSKTLADDLLQYNSK